jgi:hypothetical protein
MNFSDHAPPHFHVQYNEHRAIMSISDGEIIEGDLPANQLSLVRAWWILRENQIAIAWDNAVQRINPGKIEPLR